MEFVGFDEAARLPGRGGEAVTLEAGHYRVEAADDSQIALTGEDGKSTCVHATPGGHPFDLDAPLAVAFAGPAGERRVAVLLPGGRSLVAGGESPRDEATFTSAAFAEAVLLKFHLPQFDLVHRSDYWRIFHKFGFGTIKPDTSPTNFVPMTFPPNWVSSSVVTCYVPPAGSYGPGGPGTASGVPPFPPGTSVRRGPFPGYLVSTTPVRVTCSAGVAGKVVELRVTAHVVSLGVPTILSMTWQDVYRIVPATNGPVDFPAVIVATGRVPSGPPPAGTTWEAEVQKRLSSSTGFGVPIVFELHLNGDWITWRQMEYYASYPGGPPPVIR